jgi:plasmid stability protein
VSKRTTSNPDGSAKRHLKTHTAVSDRSMAAEAPAIVSDAVVPQPIGPRQNIATEIRHLVEIYGPADDLILPEDELADGTPFE